MPEFEVEFLPLAEADLFKIYDYIAEKAGRAVAEGYIDRIETACQRLARFPKRGTARNDIMPGLRTIGFERRVTIVFRVSEQAVTIVRVFHGGQDFERKLRDSDEI
jgi:toxin ParE1/3/4